MKNFAKFACAPALALVAALPLASPALAGESEDIIVRSTAAMEEWQADTTRDLNRHLAYAPMARSASPGEGIVQVSFRLGADGRADDVEVYSNSANFHAARTARYAVRRLGTLSEVPVYDPEGTRFLANIIFADDQLSHDRLAAKLAKSEAKRLASSGEDSIWITLGG